MPALILGSLLAAPVLGLVAWQLLRILGMGAAPVVEPEPAPPVEANPVETLSVAHGVAWRLGGGLGEVRVYDILPDPDGEGAWLGTGLGLVHVDSSGRTVTRRFFSGSPNEWARELVATRAGIGLTLTVADGHTGGNLVGTFLFDPGSGELQRIGPYARALASDESRLYGVVHLTSNLVRFEHGTGGWTTIPVVPDVRICRDVDLAHIAGALWMTHQGVSRRPGGPAAREVPCGVTRLVPGGDARTWMEEDGLVSGFGRSIVGDARSILASHGIQGDGLSAFDPATGRWTRHPGGSGIAFSANVLGLSPRSVWLGTPAGRFPLVRIDRGSGKAEIVKGVPRNHYVSAIAGYRGGAWVAWSAKHYEGETYSVETWVARVRDDGRPEER